MSILTIRAASDNANYTVGVAPPLSIDGVDLLPNESVLLKDQTDSTENGIYIAGSLLQRSTDYNSIDELSGLTIVVTEGGLNGSTQWMCINDLDHALDTTNAKIRFGLIPGFVIQTIPAELDTTGATAVQAHIQDTIDSLLQYGHAQLYWKTPPAVTGNFNATSALEGQLIHIKTAGSNVTVTLDTTGTSDFGVVFALMDSNSVKFKQGSTTLYTLTKRFQAVRAKYDSSHNTWTVVEIAVTAGGTVFLPGGVYSIDDIGIKLHPAVNLIGDNVGYFYSRFWSF